MKTITNVILGIWCAFTAFVSPIWLTLIFLNITGLIYKYDFSMDEGTAGILGLISLVIWILSVLLPDILFIRRMYSVNRKYMFVTFSFMILFAVICIAMCKWDVVKFLTTPGGVPFGF